jgi:hypothetical protein
MEGFSMTNQFVAIMAWHIARPNPSNHLQFAKIVTGRDRAEPAGFRRRACR